MTSPPPSALVCPSCGTGVFPGDRFCALCGTALPGSTGATAAVSPWDIVLRRLRAATVGEYEIKRELGRGGMAAVYLAHDIALDLKVAIKLMSPTVMMGEGMIERFRLEAVTIARLSHPNIVRVHALRQAADDLLYIVMQYIPGRTLERVVHETGPLPVAVVRSVIGQVARALAYAHQRGVIHRDVKPANIMLDATGDVVVTDFGIAKAATAPSHTTTGSVVGTPAYMSPEQCAARPLTGAADQYSLGIVAYEMLTGQVPYSGTAYTVMYGHLQSQIPSIRGMRRGCPPDLEATIMRMLAKAPEDRFPSITDAAAAAGAVPLGDHDPVRDELIRLAATDESAAVDAMYPTPASPIPPTRASIARTSAPAAQATAAASAPDTAAKPAAVSRTLVDPGNVRATPPTAEPRNTEGTHASDADAVPRRSFLWAATVVAAAVVGVLLLSRLSDTGSRRTQPDSANNDSVTASLPGTTVGSGNGTRSVRIADVPRRIVVGDTFTLRAIVTGPERPASRAVEWRSGTPSIIRIGSGGRAVALREGSSIVSARHGSAADSVVLLVLRVDRTRVR